MIPCNIIKKCQCGGNLIEIEDRTEYGIYQVSYYDEPQYTLTYQEARCDECDELEIIINN